MSREKPVQARPADKAYEAIREGILRGRWEGGAHLTEQVLGDMIGVSRTPIRDALRRLESDGLVSISPNAGARVAQWDEVEIDQIFDLRVLLEGHAAELAASTISNDRLESMSDLAAQMESIVYDRETTDFSQLASLNDRFHGHILAASGSNRLALMVGQVTKMPLVLRTFAHYDPESLARSMHHHREIVTALSCGDGVWASAVVKAHIRAGHAALSPRASIGRG